ncbi:MAG TPA: dTDP-4-amino-4,6-dideoxygalactose transaminase [Vicinamibacterales bacterium]|nr:dTDP-4-amino-4,6-dideoxygalactose transaminase [Vicinamibacterales bacterium]
MPEPVSLAAYTVPLHRLPLEDTDIEAMVAALKSGLMTGSEAVNLRLAQLAQKTLGCARAFPAPSGTHALELMMRALPLAPGDEVILPSFTFVSAANAVILAGGRPILADVDDRTLNLDPADTAARITPNTRAILTGHYAGIANGLDELSSLATRTGAVLLEDAAHALGGSYRSRALGTWGIAGTFSFHGTKNIASGEGGLMVTMDEQLAARAEIIREKGTDRSRFIRGDIDRYTWQMVGSSYLLSEPLAALVESQWRRMDRITDARRRLFDAYQAAFAPLASAGDVMQPTIPSGGEPAYHIYYLRFASGEVRNAAASFIRGRGIEASSHFVPLHLSSYAQRELGTRPGDCPVTERAADTLLRLPLYPSLAAADQRLVVDAVYAFLGRQPA